MIHRFSLRRLFAAGLTLTILLCGCAEQKSLVVLLPEDGKVSGEVTVTTSTGSQLLNQSWQTAEISRSGSLSASPAEMDKEGVQEMFGEVLATMPRPSAHYLLFFQLNSTELTPDSRPVLTEILKTINERAPAELSIVGHTDTVGSNEYNYELGLQRARAVYDLLKAMGAAPTSVELSSSGKSALLVQTGDQTFEPRNRRAEVTVR